MPDKQELIMSHSPKRRWTSSNHVNRHDQKDARSRRRAFRRLFAEALERRMLLTTITSVDPLENSHSAAGSTDIAATFDQDVVAGTATPQNFVVHGAMSQGQLVGAATTVSAAGPVITSNPTNDFAAGELVSVTATADISTTGGAANRRVWQFRTASTGSGQFVDGGTTFGTTFAEHVAFGDVDADGDLDVVFSGKELWLNDGAGGFTNSGQNLGTDLGEAGAEFGDVDGDGDLDLLSGTRISLNNGSGVFTDTGQALGGGAASAGDLDGDGDLDIMIGIPYAPNRMFFNNGSGQFTDSGQVLGNGSTDGISFGDFDNDGDLDAFERLAGTPNRVWTNDGSGVFTDSGQSVGGFLATKDAGVGDVDADGDLDILVGNSYTGMAHLYLNDGGGVFTDSGQAIANVNSPFIYGAKLADMDGDGDLDFVSLDRLTPHQIWLNDGSGVFSDSGERLTAPRASWGANVADIDGDGDMDIVEINRSPVGGRLWFNQNLTPSVTIGVDNATVAEADGTSTVTATLSATHTDVVTVDLAITGSATVTDDYTVSGTQIVIPVGATSGSVMITAVQDTMDEPDETVVVDISAITNGQESGTQQVIVTILDDDEPIPVPDVTLAVDNAAIPEAAGAAIFTATLSVATTVPVTIDLGIAGTADASDFTVSGTQIVIAPGATSGSITVTAVQDAVDEPDETVVVDITSVAGGTEAGVQQATTTITDDDEPPVPDVTLALDNPTIAEAAGVATFTLTLSEATTVPVTVDLGIGGTAAASDYTISATQVVIAPGATTGAVTVTAVQDEVNEPDETVIVDIANVVGGNEAGDQTQATTIVDDDVPPSFVVASFTARDSGFVVEFNGALDGSDLNLYDTQNAGLGAADVVVTGAGSGAVAGSLIVGASSVEFIKTGGVMGADTYTVTLRSAADGFEDTGGMLLDGNGDGTGGDNYVRDWTVADAPAGARTVSIPDFVRGPGQDVNLPADETTGIPITISEGDNVRAADIQISYDPALLTITGATAPAGGTVVVNNSTPGLAILVYFGTASLPAGPGTFINLQASVPTENASANYSSLQVLDVHDVVIGDGNDNEFPVVVDDASHFATYFADVSGNGRVNASDAAQVARYAALIDTGFAASLTVDPILVGDISGNGRINAADASRVAQFAALIGVPEIPPIPGGVVITGVAAVDLGPGLLESSERADASGPQAAQTEQAPRDVAPSSWAVDVRWSSSLDLSHDLVMAAPQEEDQLLLALEEAIDALFSSGLSSD